MVKHEKVILWVLFGLLAVLVLFFLAVRLGFVPMLPTGKVAVYLVMPVEKPVLQEVSRQGSFLFTTEKKISFAVESLIQGPNEEEKTQGLATCVPPDAKLNRCWVENDTAFLDFSPEIEAGGGTDEMEQRLAQIVFTATQFDPVLKARILIDGKFIKYFSGEGITDVENPLGRDSFQQLLGGEQ